MKYILDTNIYIYMLTDPTRLSDKQVAVLTNSKNEFYLSSASVWEMAIKIRLGKLNLGTTFENAVDKARVAQKIKLMPPILAHLKLVTLIPQIAQEDPFDLLIIAQAKVQGYPVLSSDSKFPLHTYITTIS
jgi:PIN domain nuclease of toxin-antitoxin system